MDGAPRAGLNLEANMAVQQKEICVEARGHQAHDFLTSPSLAVEPVTVTTATHQPDGLYQRRSSRPADQCRPQS
jgi:hypothetical protein